MKLGMEAEKFLTNWAIENSDDLVEGIEDVIFDDNLSTEQRIKAIYSKNLNFVFAAISAAITENNRVIEKQLRNSGIQLP